MEDTSKQIYQYLSDFWRFIKKYNNTIPTQSNTAAWDSITDNATKLTAEHQGNSPMDKLFRAWVISYLDYMAEVSKEMNDGKR